ncbi:MAG: serine hydrolase domain-containing protein [Verrucomicrobiota bacterium]
MMVMRVWVLGVLLWGGVLGCWGRAEGEGGSRVWTSGESGRQFSGELVKVEGETVSIRRDADGVVFALKKSDLVPEDVAWIEANGGMASADGEGGTETEGEVLDLSELVAGVPEAMGTPAIGVVFVEDGKVRGIGVAGVRKAGEETAVEPGDKWHLGSCTKSMTATLAATFVEEGALTWDTTLGEVLGEEMDMLEPYESVTLGLLLANRSGIPGKMPDSVEEGIDKWAALTDLSDREIMEQRATYAEGVLNVEPSSAPGTAYEYSNAGFIVAGAMLEQVSGKPWERLMEERIFEPLGMSASGFGNAAQEDKSEPTQPWPHEDGLKPREPGPGDDNSWVLGPAGTVHCSLRDVGRYMAMHAARETGPVLKEEATFEYLHEEVPDNDRYARGWIATGTGWSEGPAVAHDGSNTMNHCSIWVAPERGAAVAAFTNSAEKGSESCKEAIGRVVGEYLE